MALASRAQAYLLDTKLSLVEGIPGSGKSTTAQWIALELQKRQIEAEWFMDEHRGNPITIWEQLNPALFTARILENWIFPARRDRSCHDDISSI